MSRTHHRNFDCFDKIEETEEKPMNIRKQNMSQNVSHYLCHTHTKTQTQT